MTSLSPNQDSTLIHNSSPLVNNLKVFTHQSHFKRKKEVFVPKLVPKSSLYNLKKCSLRYLQKSITRYAKRTLFEISIPNYNKKLAHMPSIQRRKILRSFNKRQPPRSFKRRSKHKVSFRRVNRVSYLGRKNWKMSNKKYIGNAQKNLKFKKFIISPNTCRNKNGLNNYERALTSSLKRFKKSRKGIKERFKKNGYNIYPLDSEHGFDSSPESKKSGFSFSKKSTLQSRKNSSPDTCRNAARSPILDSEFMSLQQGAIPKAALMSEEHVSKKSNEINIRHSSQRSSPNVVKLIDKFLENSSNSSSKMTRTRAPMLKERARSRSLCTEDNTSYLETVFCTDLKKTSTQSSTKYMKNVSSGYSHGKRHKSLEKFSPSLFLQENTAIDKKSSSFSNLDEPERKEPKKETLLTPNYTSHIFESNGLKGTKGVTASFESINLKTPKSVLGKDKRQTSDLLQRLDNVLSELVEEEKLKIQTYEMQDESRGKVYCKSLSSQKLKLKKKTKDKKLSTVNIHPLYLSPPDVLLRYKEKFTEYKARNPRILKSDSKSKLLTMTCYQRPRPKRPVSVNDNNREDLTPNSNKEKNQLKSKMQRDCRDSGMNNMHKNSFDEEWSYPSFTSAESEKDIFINKNNRFDDEEDTCYGSDNVNSDITVEKNETAIEIPSNLKRIFKNVGDCSIDSAYTESREATPDIKINDVSSVLYSAVNDCYKPKRHEDPFTSSTRTVQVINDAKKYLLDKIKDTQSYSDNNINNILHYYSKKWTHIPELEMKIIVRSIRSDLGVRAPPKECIEFLMEENFQPNVKGSSCQDLTDHSALSLSLKKELSKEDILLDLTETIPEYLKAYKDKRKTSSLSPSPEPCKFSFSKNLSESMPRFPGRALEPLNKADNLNESSPSSSDRKISVPPIEINEMDVQTDESDEDWVKKVVGEETFREMRMIINELKEKGRNSETDPKDFEKMASELCEKFSISF